MLRISGWSNFYVIVGSSAGALIGLQFVVIALVSSLRSEIASTGARAYATPTIVFFSTVLLAAGLFSIPRQSSGWVGAELLTIGAAGTVYVSRVGRHIRRVEGYAADPWDWLWFLILPLTAYLAIVAAGVLVWSKPATALDVAGASALVLLFVGVHNAWDGAVYMVTNQPQSRASGS